MADLHERLAAKLDELQRIAGRAHNAEPGAWTIRQARGLAGVNRFNVVDAAGDELAWVGEHNDARLIAAAASPDVVLRAVAEDREVLKRHVRDHIYDDQTWHCCVCVDGDVVALAWPCPEVLSLARRHGIDPES